MQYLQGEVALTAYRQQQLCAVIQEMFPQLDGLAVYYDYFVALRASLDSHEVTVLQQLLQARLIESSQQADGDAVCWVVPRIGTISPWASKATDIVQICGLQKILRLERGIRFVLRGVPRQSLNMTCYREIHDPLTQSVMTSYDELAGIFQAHEPQPLTTIPIAQLEAVNTDLGLSLTSVEIDYLRDAYRHLKRDPTDIELMMFAQVNSEHCRHKIFNAQWKINEQLQQKSLFGMIRYTHAQHPENVLVAYHDNAAVMRGAVADRLLINPQTHVYETVREATPYLLKVETHNHPTAISPFAGAATGAGGEIRDEAATGRGAQAKAGWCGFNVSQLMIPDLPQPWEICMSKPPHLASALEIMLQAPVGAAAFNNEFGRPNILGYFRSFEMGLKSSCGEIRRGYHKPIMIAGGIGQIRDVHVKKQRLFPDVPLVVLGGPAMSIGLGGGSASSRQNSEAQEALDFASVQRANPEMQRRAQEVINACCALGEENPVLSIHDVGAGGLSNAFPELVHAADLGATLDLRAIPVAESGMSPLAIWCNEAQERYVLAIRPEALTLFAELAARERCPFAVVGKATEADDLVLKDTRFANKPIDLPMAVLFDAMPVSQRVDQHVAPVQSAVDFSRMDVCDAVKRVLQYPCVASKKFLITIGDRSVGGLVARDQLVGPWQVPVADCGVVMNDFNAYSGQAMAVGERSPIALLHHAASARMALGEVITNIAAAPVDHLGDLVLSANWMAAADYPGEGAGLYDAVQTLAMALCPTLKIAIPVGKDSLSMRSTWKSSGEAQAVTAPLSLVLTAAASVSDVRLALTPQLRTDCGETRIILIDLGEGANLIGGSVLAQVYGMIGNCPPDLDNPSMLANFFEAIQQLNRQQLLLAYHDRSDGGLLATVCEMAFAGHTGVTVDLDVLGDDPVVSLFTEELGALIQVTCSNLDVVLTMLAQYGLRQHVHVIGKPNDSDELLFRFKGDCFYRNARAALHRMWSETSYHLQKLRDHPECAQQEFDALSAEDAGLSVRVNFDFDAASAPVIKKGIKPKMAILREQGINGHVEMAAAFDRAGFISVDVHMTDLINRGQTLADFQGLAVCGGFSYGDVLGAGRGWAQSILLHPQTRDTFAAFFARNDTFTVGMCNGCQMLTHLRDIIPGAAHWPYFLTNRSEQFEARLSLVEIGSSPAVIFRGMAGSVIPVVVSHKEGRAAFAQDNDLDIVEQQQLIAMRYVNNIHRVTTVYPANPNGSVAGIGALTSSDGRVTVMMPHPERVFRTVQLSWHPSEWGENSPWMKLFYNAYAFTQ